MNIPAVDRALSIYSALADRSETKGARKRLSEHLMKKYIEGEKDEHRLTVEGLSYFTIWIGKSTPEVSYNGFIPSELPAVSARKRAACFSPSRCELLPSLLAIALVVVSSSLFRPWASLESSDSKRAPRAAFSLGR